MNHQKFFKDFISGDFNDLKNDHIWGDAVVLEAAREAYFK